MKYDSNDLYYHCFLSAISGSSLMNHDVAACRIIDFFFHPPISNPLFSKMVLNKGCHTPYGYGIVFQMPKFRASHMFWSLANRGLKTIDKFTIRKAMKKQYIHTKIMI